MPSLVKRVARRAGTLFDERPWLRRFLLRQPTLRILCYHGVCPDHLLSEPWVPNYAVGARAFREQMECLLRFADVAPLATVVDRACAGTLDRLTVAVTFDDVSACTFRWGRPVLDQLGVRASFYIATGLAD